MSSCPRQPTQTTINHYLDRHYSALLGSARWRDALLNEQRVLPSCRVPRAQVSTARRHDSYTTARDGTAFVCGESDLSLFRMIRDRGTNYSFVPRRRFFLNAHKKRTTKTSCEGTKMSCDGLTLGKIIFGYTPRVVLPPQQPFSNATMEQVQRWGEDVSNDGLDAI